MSGKIYWKNKLPIIFLNILSLTLLSVFLWLNGNTLDVVLTVIIVWNAAFVIGMLYAYRKRKKYLDGLLAMTEQLGEKYLIAEVMERPGRADDLVYRRILKLAEKSMLEQVGAVGRERKEYKESIEQWVHEIKTPITAMKLLCENHRGELSGELLPLLEKTDHYTEQALYYARSEHTEKDYVIREVDLIGVAHQAIADNKYLLLQNNVSIQMAEENCLVYTDEKWIRFILNQLIVNSVKYRAEKPELRFSSRRENGQVFFCVLDNGIGIAAGDLPRIFDKGFTGQNGRKRENATGMGLYLCRRLCDKLGIGVDASSDGAGTTISLIFTLNDLIHQVQER